jgi:hypothetical protein
MSYGISRQGFTGTYDPGLYKFFLKNIASMASEVFMHALLNKQKYLQALSVYIQYSRFPVKLCQTGITADFGETAAVKPTYIFEHATVQKLCYF